MFLFCFLFFLFFLFFSDAYTFNIQCKQPIFFCSPSFYCLHYQSPTLFTPPLTPLSRPFFTGFLSYEYVFFFFSKWRVLIHLFHRSNYAFGAFLSFFLSFLSLLPFLFLTIFPLLFFFLCNVPLLSLSEPNTQWNVTCTN